MCLTQKKTAFPTKYGQCIKKDVGRPIRSLENQWLEDVFLIEISSFLGDVRLFLVVLTKMP